eukprot:Rhum_TRINITY_DN24905_c0_g1::Rhum_TRINITY_DN24905_c0_g1_i1::g.180518::m.180518
MLKQSTTLLAKKRRSFITSLRHRWMMKLWTNFNGAGQEQRITFDTVRDLWLTRLDTVEGEAQAGRYDDSESDQFNADYTASRGAIQNAFPQISAVEAYHMPFVLSPGELPFAMSRTHRHYDVDTKTYRELLAPFHWKNLPGDEGLAANRSILYTGEGSGDYLEPTIENVMGASEHGARFLPATPEEAAEIEAEEKYHRDIRNSMVAAVADLKLVEVPPYYITGQKNWQTVTPWYKAKKEKGTLTEQEDASTSWDELVAWKTT